MARKSAGKDIKRASARRQPLPEPLRGARNAGLVVAWAGAVLCGWKARAPLGTGQAPAPQADLLSAVLRGAAAWLGLTLLWLAAIGLCQRIVLGSGDQAFRHSGVPEDPPNT